MSTEHVTNAYAPVRRGRRRRRHGAERHHFIPQSLLKRWAVEGDRVRPVTGGIEQGPCIPTRALADDTWTFPHVSEAAMVVDGNQTIEPVTGRLRSREPEWTDYFDSPFGAFLRLFHGNREVRREFRVRAKDAPITASLGMVPAIAGFMFRPPQIAAQRLETSLKVASIIRGVGPSHERVEYVSALAAGLGIEPSEVRRAAHDLLGMRRVASDPTVADDDVLADVVDGLLDMALIARDQWMGHLDNVAITIARTPKDSTLLLGDCVVLVEEAANGEWLPSPTTIVWDDVLSHDDETRRQRDQSPREGGRTLRLTMPISPRVLLRATFAPQGWATDVRNLEVSLSPDDVIEVNRATEARSAHFVISSEILS